MKKIVFLFLSFGLGSVGSADVVSLKSVWKKINADSAAQDSARLQTEALVESQSRADKHWLPRIYLDARSYQTNDSGASFFGLLSQRSLQSSDFNPDSINHPEAKIYSKGSLGIDWALYEGGMRSSMSDLQKFAVSSQQKSTSQLQLDQYSQVCLAYGSVGLLDQQKIKIQELNSSIEKLIKNYQLGSKSNPVGYSGLLGMRSLANRLAGLLKQYEAHSQASIVALDQMGFHEKDWKPQFKNTFDFVNLYMTQLGSGSAEGSFKTQALRENIKMSEQAIKMEKARFRPRVGAFAEGDLFQGSRDSANSYVAGVYLQWSLFNPSDYGTVKEAQLKSKAAQRMAEASEQQERAERLALIESAKALHENINLMLDSHNILIEQSKMTETLFRNGSINALQIVEVLSRRADLIAQQGEAELELLKVRAQILAKENFDISKNLDMESGKNYEK